MTTFDQCDTTLPCAQRNVTTVPTQALAMMNNQFTHDRSRALARRSQKTSDRLEKQVRAAWRYSLGRNPTEEEHHLSVAHLKNQVEQFRDADRTPSSKTLSPPKPVLHLTAGSGVTVSDAGRVLQWESLTGQHDATQLIPDAQPTLAPDSLNGQPAIHFDGNGRFLQLKGELLSSAHCTILAVVSDHSPTARLREIVSNWNSGGNSVTSIFLGLRDRNLVRFSDNFSPAGQISKPQKPFMFTAINAPSGVRVWQNTALIASRAGPLADRKLGTEWVIGQQGNINGEFWQGDIAEILIFAQPLEAGHLQTLWKQLADRYELPFEPEFSVVRQETPEQQAFASLCHVLLNSNEFLYVD